MAQIKQANKNIVFSSARRYLRFGSPVVKKYSAAAWTLNKLGIKEIQNYDMNLQQVWLESLGIKTINPIDEIITLYYAYLDVKNYFADKLVAKLFELNILFERRPFSKNGDKYNDIEYLRAVLLDNHYNDRFLEDSRLAKFSLAERFYISLMMSYPLPWSYLANEIKITDGFDTKPRRFLRLIKLVDFLCLNIEDLGGSGQIKIDFSKPNRKKANAFGCNINDLSDFTDLFAQLNEISDLSRRLIHTALPEKKILLVEGNTEQIALPHLAKCMGVDFDELGIAIICVGGKNQMLKQFMDWISISKLPVYVLLDADAVEQVNVIKSSLRAQDKVFVIEEGEFEDTFDIDTLIDLSNQMLIAGQPLIVKEEFLTETRRTAALNKIWRLRGLGDFDKVGFANAILDYVENENQVPSTIKNLLKNIGSN